MELFLNLLWLALAIAAPVLWLSRHDRSPARQRIIVGAIALACIVILLFPVISATDDLRAFQAAVEESNTGKKLIVDTLTHWLLSGVLAVGVIAAAPLHARTIERPVVIFYSHHAAPQICKRPPPAGVVARLN